MKISGKKLKYALKVKDLTQLEASEKLGVSRQTLSTWLSKEELDTDSLHLVKTKLDIDLDKNILNEPEEEYRVTNHTQDLIDQLKDRLKKQDEMYQVIIDAKNEIIDLLKYKK